MAPFIALSAPAGWSLVRRNNDSGGQVAEGVYVHVILGPEPSSYTWNFTSGNNAVAGIAAYSGVNTAAPIDVSGGQANAVSTNVTALYHNPNRPQCGSAAGAVCDPR